MKMNEQLQEIRFLNSKELTENKNKIEKLEN